MQTKSLGNILEGANYSIQKIPVSYMNMKVQYLSSGTRTMLMLCVAIVLISEACVLFVLLSAPGRNVGLDFIQYD